MAFRTISEATEEIAPALKRRVFRLGVAPELINHDTKLARALRAPTLGLRLRLVRAHDPGALHEDAADAILRTSDGPHPSYNVEVVSLRRFDTHFDGARLVTHPGLAGCREHRAPLSLLRGSR